MIIRITYIKIRLCKSTVRVSVIPLMKPFSGKVIGIEAVFNKREITLILIYERCRVFLCNVLIVIRFLNKQVSFLISNKL